MIQQKNLEDSQVPMGTTYDPLNPKHTPVVPKHSSSETRRYQTADDFDLVTRLLENTPGYEIPQEARKAIIYECQKAITSETSAGPWDSGISMTDKLAAMRVILMADKHNLDMVKVVMPRKQEVTINCQKLSDQDLKAMAKEIALEAGLL